MNTSRGEDIPVHQKILSTLAVHDKSHIGSTSKIYDLIFSKKHDLDSRIFRKFAFFVLFVFNLF